MKAKQIARVGVSLVLAVAMGGLFLGSNAAGPQGQAVRRPVKSPRVSLGKNATLRQNRVGASGRRTAQVYPSWAYAFQGEREDEARGAFGTADGGMIFWGDTRILGGPSQAWMTKLSQQGSVEWSRVYGPSNLVFNEVTPTPDGGFVAASQVIWGSSLDGAVVKISAAGLVEWSRRLGTAVGDKADSAEQTADGGFVVAGITNANAPDGSGDFWIAKLTSGGDTEWTSILGGPGQEGDWNGDARNITVRQASDGGYFLAGDSDSYGAGDTDIWILKLSPSGTIEWQRTYGGPGHEAFPNSGPHTAVTPDGGLIVACGTTSFSTADGNGWLFRLSSAGDILFQKRIGGPKADTFTSISPTSDGGFVLGGRTESYPDDGFRHGWAMKLDASLEVQWQRSFGRDSHFDIQGIDQGPDGSFAAGGSRTPTSSSSWYWDVYRDAVVIKIAPDGSLGAPGNDFVTVSAASATTTDATPQDTSILPIPWPMTNSVLNIGATDVVPQQEILSGTGLQPPFNVSLGRAINRGLFSGEVVNTVQWSPNPWNASFDLESYAIYRQQAGGVGGQFAKIATVPGTVSAYVDPNLPLTDKSVYRVTAIDTAGHESPMSRSVGN